MPSIGGAPIDPAVFGYIRVSQAEGESGLATQRRILTDHGLRNDRIFTDVASGRDMRRPSWMELRGMLKPGDTVVVPRLDRLARNLWEGLKTIQELHDQGINIRSLAEGLDTGDGSPTSRLMLHMLLSLAEWERDTIRDRIRAGVDRAAAEGRTGGRPPALSSEKVEAVKIFLEHGGSVSAAARAFGVSRPTVRAVRDGIYAGRDDITRLARRALPVITLRTPSEGLKGSPLVAAIEQASRRVRGSPGPPRAGDNPIARPTCRPVSVPTK